MDSQINLPMYLEGGLKNVLWPVILFSGVEEGSVKLFKKFLDVQRNFPITNENIDKMK